MFTGIVECMGTVDALEEHDESHEGGGGTSLTIRDAEEILGDAHLGDSICVNGACLTITSFTRSAFKVGVAPETLRRTNLGALQAGARVNLERAVSATATRMGGHFVQGHVDTTATIARAAPDGNALTLRLRPRDARVLRHVVEKGYVALDGTSLTVTRVDDAAGWWEVMLVAYTQQKVVLARKAPGDEVNVEVDMLGKYVEKSVQGYLDGLLGGKGAEGGEEGEDEEKKEIRGGGLDGYLEKMVRRIVDERLSEMRT